MSITKKVGILLLMVIAIVLLPYLGAYLAHSGEFPDKYFQYPPLAGGEKAGFSWPVFIAFAIAFVLVITLYIYPYIFGFKRVAPVKDEKGPKVGFPLWFWLGLLMWGGTVFILWTKLSGPKWVINWADLPIFWGFTLILDGIVYKRTGGKSIISKVPQEIIGIGTASVSGWLLFEWLNFFVNDNWLYPKGDMLPVNEFVLYAVMGTSGLLPMAFEWFSLFKTFGKFRHKYSDGPRLAIPRWLSTVLLVACLAGLFMAGFMPNLLFFSLWLSPLIIITIVLERLDIWTPFNAIKHGNWSPVLIFGLTYFIQGMLLESWNYFSGVYIEGDLMTYNPAYWTYSIPYVDRFHFGEMPVLGLMGYIPFGIYCWIWWIVYGFMLNVPSRYYNYKMEDGAF